MEFKTVPCCEEACVHAGAVERVRAQLPPDEQLYDLAELFKIFGDSSFLPRPEGGEGKSRHGGESMIQGLDYLRQPDLLGMTVRVLLALVCGGTIGWERTEKRRPAGFRTHILICLGAAMTTATSQYLYVVMHYPISVSRMGAQVIAGVSFIGAGAIMMTKWRRVRGLTTAAGLWVVAIVGLCCGTAFYEGAVYTTALVLMAEVFFSKLEYRLLRDNREVTVYAEYEAPSCLEEIVSKCHMLGVKIVDVEITRKENSGSCAVLALRSRQSAKEDIIRELAGIKGVNTVVEA